MSDERKKLYAGQVSQAIPGGQYCGTSDIEIFFTAPIDLLPDDQVIIDPPSGQPLAVYRNRRKIWQFQGDMITMTTTLKFVGSNGLAELLEKAR